MPDTGRGQEDTILTSTLKPKTKVHIFTVTEIALVEAIVLQKEVARDCAGGPAGAEAGALTGKGGQLVSEAAPPGKPKSQPRVSDTIQSIRGLEGQLCRRETVNVWMALAGFTQLFQPVRLRDDIRIHEHQPFALRNRRGAIVSSSKSEVAVHSQKAGIIQT